MSTLAFSLSYVEYTHSNQEGLTWLKDENNLQMLHDVLYCPSFYNVQVFGAYHRHVADTPYKRPVTPCDLSQQSPANKMSYMDMLSVLAAPLAMAYVVHTRLEYAQPGVKELLAPSPSEEELSQIQVTAPSLLEGLPPQQDANRIITGASGHIGGSIVQHLLARGEKNLRLIDRDTPDADVLANSGVEYIKCDITDEKAVREAICKPFPHSTLPTVIYHAAAIIRFVCLPAVASTWC